MEAISDPRSYPTKNPILASPKNSFFYFAQEGMLREWCKEHNGAWNITFPGFILGAVPDAAVNLTYGLALIASVQKELGRKLSFPADVTAWDVLKDQSSAALIGYHAEWTVLTAEAENQAFNIVDDSPFTYGKFWPVLASWYGIEYDIPPDDTSKYGTQRLPLQPPPRGFGEAGVLKAAWSFEEWAAQPDVRAAWQTLKKRHGLVAPRDPFENAKEYIGLVDTDISVPWSRVMSMSKSKKLGWHGYVDTHEAILDAIEQLAELKMVPPIEKRKDSTLQYHGY